MRTIGVAGFLIPIVSIAAAATLQPALLSLYGRRGTRRVAVARPAGLEAAGSTRRRRARVLGAARALDHAPPVAFLALVGALLLAAAMPAVLAPAHAGLDLRHPAARRSRCAASTCSRRARAGRGRAGSGARRHAASRPGCSSPRVEAAIGRLVDGLEHDPEVAAVYYRAGGRFVDPTARYAQVVVAGRHEYGFAAGAGVRPPAARPADPGRRLPGRGAGAGRRRARRRASTSSRALRVFPWLVLAVLVLTYLLLMRAFRSLLLPLKAVLLNLLSVGAGYGMLVVVFQLGRRHGRARPLPVPAGRGLDPDLPLRDALRPLDGLRGLSRHAHARGVGRGPRQRARGRARPRAHRPDHHRGGDDHGGRVLGLHGRAHRRPAGVRLGLAVAIFVDATIVRALLVPA